MRGHRGALARTSARGFATSVPLVKIAAAPTTAAAAGATFSLGSLFLFFMKVGAVLFGSGYVLLAFLRADLVDRWHWLSEAQLLDAVAVGQITPGPVFTTATFIGYLLGGTRGALVATLGIFLPLSSSSRRPRRSFPGCDAPPPPARSSTASTSLPSRCSSSSRGTSPGLPWSTLPTVRSPLVQPSCSPAFA